MTFKFIEETQSNHYKNNSSDSMAIQMDHENAVRVRVGKFFSEESTHRRPLKFIYINLLEFCRYWEYFT